MMCLRYSVVGKDHWPTPSPTRHDRTPARNRLTNGLKGKGSMKLLLIEKEAGEFNSSILETDVAGD